MRLAILFRQPLSEVRNWSASDVRLLSEYLSREQAPDERIEYAVSYLTATYVNAHRPKGESPRELSEFLLFRNAWKRSPETDARYSDVDKSFLKALMQ